MLLSVAMEGRCPCPAMAIGFEHMRYLPESPIGYQHVVRYSGLRVTLEQDESHPMLDLGDMH